MAKRALLVGCNYPGSKVELHGCVNDVRRMHSSLTSRFGFDESDILVLVDTDRSGMQPTGANIRSCLAKLIRGTQSGDILVFHYSGHGTQVPPEAGAATDDTGAEEAIVPTDMNLLTDDDFRELVNEIPSGATFTFISDSCHSGGLIDSEKEQIGDSVGGGGGGLLGMVSQVFQGSSAGRDLDYSQGYGRQRGYGGNSSYGREQKDGDDDEGERYGRRRGGVEDNEGYEGQRESEYEGGYGRQRESEYEGGYGRQRESEYEGGYGRQRESEYGGGYGGQRESEYGGGYGGQRESEYEGSYGGRRQEEEYGQRESEYEGGYGRRRQEEEYGSGYDGGAYAQQGDDYGDSYRSGGRRPSPVESKEIPVDMLLQILSERAGHQVDIGNIRTTLFDMFGASASPSVKMFANLVFQQLEGGHQGGIMGAVSSLATQFLQSKLDGQDPEQAASYLAPAQSAGQYRPRSRRGGSGSDSGILLSGCQSNETSADANPSGNAADAYGAFSNAIQMVLSETDSPISNRDLILQVRAVLQKQGFKQHPCLYCSDGNADAVFICE